MPRRTRREFLEDSMFATAAAMATTTATNAFAQEQETPKSANDRLNVAVVGVRGRGGSHIGALTLPRAWFLGSAKRRPFSGNATQNVDRLPDTSIDPCA